MVMLSDRFQLHRHLPPPGMLMGMASPSLLITRRRGPGVGWGV